MITLSSIFTVSAKPRIDVVTEEWKPFNYTNKQGEIVGRSTEKVKHILGSIGFDYQIRSYPWTRAMGMAERHANTLIYSIYRTSEREQKYQWVCPLMAPVKVYLYRLSARHDIQIRNLTDAKNYVVSVNRNDSGHEFLRDNGFVEGGNLDLSPDSETSARKFFAGRVDFLLQSEWEMSETVKVVNKRDSDVVRTIEVSHVNELEACMAFSLQTDAALVEQVQQALDKYNRDFGLD